MDLYSKIKLFYNEEEDKFLSASLEISNCDLKTFNIQIGKHIFTNLFKNITFLDCSDNPIISLPNPESLPNLQILDCRHTNIEFIPTYKQLIELNCSSCQIIKINYLPEIINIDFSNNFVSEVPELPKVKKIFCSRNKIKKIPDNISAIEYYCDHNVIEQLGNLPSVIKLDCSHNLLTHLPIIPNAKTIYLTGNKIRSLNKKTIPKVKSIYVSYYYLILISESLAKTVKIFKYNISNEQYVNVYSKFIKKMGLELLEKENNMVKNYNDDKKKSSLIEIATHKLINSELRYFFNTIELCFKDCFILDCDIMAQQLSEYIINFQKQNLKYFKNNITFNKNILDKKKLENFIKEIYLRMIYLEIVIKDDNNTCKNKI